MNMVSAFSATAGLYGGLLIGIGSVIFLLFNGKIAGISGILGGMLKKWDSSAWWRVPFIVGLPLGAWLLSILRGQPIVVVLDTNGWETIMAGLLVGFGTRLGNGCTSGHGVCGLARLSGRSLTATATFMATAILTVFVLRHVVGG